ncbi:MAG: 50S ribosomal protein L11 methyltransferase [Proteobacteria bacterium]|nr:50S ribosomal protein L11 methyltransferase [Pseudomonadota bacterium]
MWQATLEYANDNEKDNILNCLYLFNIKGIWEKEGKLIVYFEDKEELDSFKESLQDRKLFFRRVKDNLKWNSLWKKFHRPVSIRPFFITPTFFKGRKPKGLRKILVKPSFAFGTGSHATTKICIYFLVKYVKKGMKVIDMGTGTGILAIISEKLGAEEVYATDIDPIALKEAKDNIKRNRCKKIVLGNEIDNLNNFFDLCVANIVLDELLKLKELFKKILKEKGILILSGILEEQIEELLEKYSDSFRLINRKKKRDRNFNWFGLVFEKI